MHHRLRCALPLLVLVATGIASAAEPAQIEVFRSGTDGYHTYRIPALVVTQQGTLLAFCEGRKTSGRDHGDVDLVLRRSRDNGATWMPMQLVHEEGDAATITIGNPCPVVDPATGTIWLSFCRDNDDVFITSSTDDGATWAEPKEITAAVKQPGWTWYATGPGNGIALVSGPHAGRLVLPCDHRRSAEKELSRAGRSHVIYSDDHGRTWQLGGATDIAMNECAVAELADGTLMLNIRSYRGQGCRAVSLSSDGGLTWSTPVDDPTLVEPLCQASLIASRSGADVELLFSNPASASSRTQMTVRHSRDGGRSWPVARVLHAGPAAYSCLAELPDGTFCCLYERGQARAYETITIARFSRDWLEQPPSD